jgi:hypothetical protein
MSGKLTALTYSTDTVQHAVTLKWRPIFVCHTVIVKANQLHDKKLHIFFPTHKNCALFDQDFLILTC